MKLSVEFHRKSADEWLLRHCVQADLGRSIFQAFRSDDGAISVRVMEIMCDTSFEAYGSAAAWREPALRCIAISWIGNGALLGLRGGGQSSGQGVSCDAVTACRWMILRQVV